MTATSAGRFLRAALAGLVAAIAGAAAWYGLREVTGHELGVIAIALGFAVGKAVGWGSRGRGGWVYQLLAMFLTYSSIVMTAVPEVVGGLERYFVPLVLKVVMAFVIWFTIPVAGGATDIVDLLIIAIALVAAWWMNKRIVQVT